MSSFSSLPDISDSRVIETDEAGYVCIRCNHCAQRLVITDAGMRKNIYLLPVERTLSMSQIRDFLSRAVVYKIPYRRARAWPSA